MHGARRMVRREVQRLEVVPVVLDLGAIDALVAEPREDRRDALQRPGDRMDAAALAIAAGQRNVDRLGGKPAVELGLFQHGPARRQRVDEALLYAVHFGAACLALLGRQGAQGLQRAGDDAALAQQAHAQGFKRVQRLGLFDASQRLRGLAFQIIHRCGPGSDVQKRKRGGDVWPPPRLIHILSSQATIKQPGRPSPCRRWRRTP